uniref:Secreted protein n=1 Tax=Streptomyces sp. NBC_00049 TaxID=2903617 RepID=A0AAU2JUS9_9ACTN
MPRGRHRNPEPLHRLLTPTAVAGVSVISAGSAWLLAGPDDGLALRLLVALTAAAGVAGAVVLRLWDSSAGRRVAELARERVKDEWKTDERIAELESDLEEARMLRARLDAKLRAKRVELAGLRGEHAALLRRYATAETERASALEGRRLLAIEASAAPAPAPRELPAVSEERTSAGAPTAVGYARAHAALVALAHKSATKALPPAAPAPAPAPDDSAAVPEAAAEPASTVVPASAAVAEPVSPSRSGSPSVPVTGSAQVAPSVAAAVPARRMAATMAPYAAQRRTTSRVEGGFDFFGTKNAAQARAAIEAVQNEDLADVVGAEALAVHEAESVRTPAEEETTAEARPAGQVIDLTAHDETERIDVARLRTAIS